MLGPVTTDGYQNSEESCTDYSTDEGKRKRDNEIGRDIFKRSRRTIRTPKKGETQDNKEGSMEEIKEMMRNIFEEIKEMRKENKEYQEDMKLIKQENEKLKLEIENLRNRIEKMETIEQKVEKIEQDKRKNNLVITGLKINAKNNEEIKQKTELFLNEHIQAEINIKKAYKTNDMMIVVELEDFEKKLEILKRKGKITYFKDNKIYIDSDLTENERKIQKELRDKAKIEKEKKNRVKIGYQYIIINGQKWIWNKKLEKLEERGNGKENPKN